MRDKEREHELNAKHPIISGIVTTAVIGGLVAAVLIARGQSSKTAPAAPAVENCFQFYNFRERAVLDTLSSTNGYLLQALKLKDGRSACSAQRRLLDLLGRIPRDQRDEEFAGVLDRISSR